MGHLDISQVTKSLWYFVICEKCYDFPLAVFIMEDYKRVFDLKAIAQQRKQHTGCVTESSLSLVYFVLIIHKKETLVENFRILQFQVPDL